MKKSNALTRYFVDSFSELRKVTWPTKEQTARLTVVTLVFSLVVALFLGVLDYGLTQGFTWVIARF